MNKKPTKCCHPNCFKCPYEDCRYENPARIAGYYRRGERDRQNRYRAIKKALSGTPTMEERMIEKQNKIYDFVLNFTKKNLYPPTTTEIQKALGISGNAEVTMDLKRLHERGLLTVDKGARAIRLNGFKIVEIS